MPLIIDQVPHVEEALTRILTAVKRDMEIESDIDDVLVQLLNRVNQTLYDHMDEWRYQEGWTHAKLLQLLDEDVPPIRLLEGASLLALQHVERNFNYLPVEMIWIDRSGRFIYRLGDIHE